MCLTFHDKRKDQFGEIAENIAWAGLQTHFPNGIPHVSIGGFYFPCSCGIYMALERNNVEFYNKLSREGLGAINLFCFSATVCHNNDIWANTSASAYCNINQLQALVVDAVCIHKLLFFKLVVHAENLSPENRPFTQLTFVMQSISQHLHLSDRLLLALLRFGIFEEM